MLRRARSVLASALVATHHALSTLGLEWTAERALDVAEAVQPRPLARLSAADRDAVLVRLAQIRTALDVAEAVQPRPLARLSAADRDAVLVRLAQIRTARDLAQLDAVTEREVLARCWARIERSITDSNERPLS